MVPMTHLIHGATFSKRQKCVGPAQLIYGSDQEDWTSCMVFKCVYGCDRSCIPYELLEYHIQNECP